MVTSDPIYSLDLDEELLAHLPDPDAWVVIQGEGVGRELIEDELVAQVFEWQRAHWREHHRVATASVLADEWELDFRPPETAIGDLLDRLRERYMNNQGRDRLRDIIELQRTQPLAVAQELLKQGRELQNLLYKRGEVFGSGDFDRAMHRYSLKADQGPGASFGHTQLDEHFYGMRGLSMLLGYKKTMKSWLMVQCLAANAEQGRCGWLYSLELPAEETDMRLRCLLAGIPWWKWVRNAFNLEDRKALQEASDLIDGLGTYRVVKPPHGKRGIQELVHNARDNGADLVLIDQLQYVENDKGKSLGRLNDTGEYFGVLDEARDLSDHGPIYIAHQFGRAAMGADSMPDIALAKGSSAIEEVCTLALGIWADPEMRRSGLLEIGTLISRNAPSFASWDMEFELTRDCRFTIVGRNDEE